MYANACVLYCTLCAKTIWCFYTGFRLLSNYEIFDGALLARKDILEETNQVKENVSGCVPLACRNLSLAVKELWDGKVKIVRRGERQNQQFFYLNLKKKSSQLQPTSTAIGMNDSVALLFSSHELPVNWASVVDCGNRLNFIRLENWAYRQNRVKIELSVTKTAPSEFNFSISSRGREIEIDNLLQIKTLAEQSLKERVITLIKLLD